MDAFRKLPELDEAEEDRIIEYLVGKLQLRPADPYRHLLGKEMVDEAFEQRKTQGDF